MTTASNSSPDLRSLQFYLYKLDRRILDRSAWGQSGPMYRALDRLGIKLPYRPENAFASHLPVLIGLSLLFPIRTVLEFGCGEFSTLTFLDRTVFPHLRSIDSYEHDAVWLKKIRAAAGADQRLHLHLAEDDASLAVAQANVAAYDLVFIDNSVAAPQRAATIDEVARQLGNHSLVAIHDFENEFYRRAAQAFPRVFRFTALYANTGIAWTDARFDGGLLPRLNRAIRNCAPGLQADDRAGWLRALSSFRKS